MQWFREVSHHDISYAWYISSRSILMHILLWKTFNLPDFTNQYCILVFKVSWEFHVKTYVHWQRWRGTVATEKALLAKFNIRLFYMHVPMIVLGMFRSFGIKMKPQIFTGYIYYKKYSLYRKRCLCTTPITIHSVTAWIYISSLQNGTFLLHAV